jgi:c-di-GMP-binding flagellar brake protein YcgR
VPGIDNRKTIRTKLKAQVKVSHPETGDLSLHTGDISDGGAYILTEGNKLPELNEVVDVQVQGMGGGEAPVLKMRIVRLDKKGIGLEFLTDDE